VWRFSFASEGYQLQKKKTVAGLAALLTKRVPGLWRKGARVCVWGRKPDPEMRSVEARLHRKIFENRESTKMSWRAVMGAQSAGAR